MNPTIESVQNIKIWFYQRVDESLIVIDNVKDFKS